MRSPVVAMAAVLRALGGRDDELAVEVNPMALFLLVLAVDRGLRDVPHGSPMEETLVTFVAESLLRLEEIHPGTVDAYVAAGGSVVPSGH